MTLSVKVQTFKPGQNQGEVIDLGVHTLDTILRENEYTSRCVGPYLQSYDPRHSLWALVGKRHYKVRHMSGDNIITILPEDAKHLQDPAEIAFDKYASSERTLNKEQFLKAVEELKSLSHSG